MNACCHLILGCGYLGRHLRQQLLGQPCWFTNRKMTAPVSAPEHRQLCLDINQADSWKALDELGTQRNMVACLMVPPGKIDPAVLPLFLDRLDRLSIKRRILVSSTVVFGQQERVVDADSNVLIDSERARRQYEIEQIWMQDSEAAHVVRLAGIYGPGRIIGRQSIEDGATIPGNPDGWLNLIHVEDAASLLLQAARQEHVANFELGCDGTPRKRREYYTLLAECLRQPAPRFPSGQEQQPRGRCCNNELTIARTGWLPQHTDLRQTLEFLIQAGNT